MYDLLFLRNADIGEIECDTVMATLVFLINNTPMTLNVGNYVFYQKVLYEILYIKIC